MDLAELSGQPLTITLAGRQWQVKPRTLRELGELQAWFKREIPSPLTRVLASLGQADALATSIKPAVRELAVSVATDAELRWPPRVGSYAWSNAVDSAGKVGHVVAFALSPCHPEIDDAAGDKLADEAQPGELGTLACALFDGRLPDPKGEPPTLGATTTSDPSPSGTTGQAGFTIS